MTDSTFDERSGLVGALEASDDVKHVESREGCELVFVEFVEITAEHESIDRARQLGFDVERVDAYNYVFEFPDGEGDDGE